MHKLTLLLQRREGLAADAFTATWLDAPAHVPDGLTRHVHNRATARSPIENAPPAPFDGVEELWFEDRERANAFLWSQAFREEWLAPRRTLLGTGPLLALTGAPMVPWESGAAAAPDAKLIVFPVRRPGLTFEAFVDHWTVRHAALALGGPHTRERLARLEDTPATGELAGGLSRAPFDGVGTIEFVSREGLLLEFSSDHYREHLATDEPRFTDSSASRAMAVEAVTVFERPAERN